MSSLSRNLIPLAVLLGSCLPVSYAERIVADIEPSAIIKAQAAADSATISLSNTKGRSGVLRISQSAAGSGPVRLITLDGRPVTKSTYAVRGQVAYDTVVGEGYLELWSHFSGGEQYYTRSLAGGGPLQSLKGTSDWRRFVLPFTMSHPGRTPERLDVNIVLPDGGTVYLDSLELVEFEADENPLTAAGSWWSARTGGLIGGILGAVLGLWGAAVGVLGGRLRARRLVLSLLLCMIGIGLILAITGLAAVVSGQPYAVYYPLLLCGLLGAGLAAGMLPLLKKRYAEAELRRMKAMDSGRDAGME